MTNLIFGDTRIVTLIFSAASSILDEIASDSLDDSKIQEARKITSSRNEEMNKSKRFKVEQIRD